ncbi:FKBP-type peptidyl-prolyl cis-trans isomerase [Pontibacter sp. 13R65]|uniref:FKBP-type peptidyl-prolyl cis-trans isomerase n=1 Tax=Pontibacter sp. 13R65 TaxID=3127458 RepID=UPI00301BC2B2
MLFKTKLLLPVIAGALLFQACNKKDEFQTSANGLKYKIYKLNDKGEYEAKGKVADTDTSGARMGQIISFHMTLKNAEDSVLVDTRTQKPAFPAMLPIVEPSMKGGLEEALMMLSDGDSAVFKINADSLFAHTYKQPLPPFIKQGSDLTYFVKVDRVMNRDQAEAYQQEVMENMQKQEHAEMLKNLKSDSAMVAQLKTDSTLIQKYVQEQKLSNVQKSPLGVYYTVTQAGQGPQAAAGDLVSVHYKLSNLSGKQLETSEGNDPFKFPLGRGQVIPGWDDAIAQLKEGSKATLLIPSPLAYGAREQGPDMPANSILRFDIELVDVEKQ